MSLKKVKLEKIYINTEKEGQPLKTKNGDEYTMVVIEVNGQKASMFCDNKRNSKNIDLAKTWKPGDIIQVVIEKNGDFLNFKIPGKYDELEARVASLEAIIEGTK
jgi:hypothetical protein